jgi:hypothetical protein
MIHDRRKRKGFGREWSRSDLGTVQVFQTSASRIRAYNITTMLTGSVSCSSAVKIEAVHFSKTSGEFYLTIQRDIREDNTLSSSDQFNTAEITGQITRNAVNFGQD